MKGADDRHAYECPDVQLRAFPYPYRAMLAICSDLDGTPDKNVYLGIMRFLNTTEATPMGLGVGLEVGNSIHFRARPQRFSYWDTDDAGREMVRTLIQSGHIDCLHSFGEFVYLRDEAERAISELEQYDCRLKVWVDHGGAVTNFGPDIMQGYGDVIDHPAYHADLTVKYGINYIWRGRTTSITGQDTPLAFRVILNFSHPVISGRTMLKEVAKHTLAKVGNERYSMHQKNEILRPAILRDGQPIYEFMRCNPHWGGVSCCTEGRYIGEVITDSFLNCLVKRGGICVLYTHLGRVDNPSVPFDEKAVASFRLLHKELDGGRILITTTRRLLGYCRAIREIDFNTQRHERLLCINVNTRNSKNWIGELSAAELAGLTFYVPDPKATNILIESQKIKNLKINPPDNTGRPSVSLPWDPLEFPRM